MKRYAPFRLLTDPARDTASVWRLVLGFFVATSVMYGLSWAVFAFARGLMQPDDYWAFITAIETAQTPFGLLVLLFLMGAMGVGAFVACEIVHSRAAIKLFGPGRLFWRQFIAVAGAILLLNTAVALLPPWPFSGTLEPGLPPMVWVSLLPITLIALLVQTGSEEVLFRGYLQSQLGARFSSPWIWLTVPSALFAAGHYAPDLYGDNAFAVTLWAGVFGIAAADLTARSGTLGPAIALHLVNNTFAIALVSLGGEMSGLALYRLPFGPEDTEALAAILPVDLSMIGLSWLAARLAIRA